MLKMRLMFLNGSYFEDTLRSSDKTIVLPLPVNTPLQRTHQYCTVQ